MGIKKYSILFLILLLSSCIKQSESITSLATPSTIAELQKEALMNTALQAGQSELSKDAQATLNTQTNDPTIFYLNIKYKLTNIDVFEVAQMPNAFEQIGNTLLKTLAKVFFKAVGTYNVDINDISLVIPDLNIDRSIVKSLKIKKIFLQYNQDVDQGSDWLANFSFIDSLELARKVTVPNVGNVETLFLSYRKNRNFCAFKCLQFDILEDNIIDILRPNTNVRLKPILSIKALPDVSDIKLDGVIEMQVGLKLPF